MGRAAARSRVQKTEFGLSSITLSVEADLAIDYAASRNYLKVETRQTISKCESEETSIASSCCS